MGCGSGALKGVGNQSLFEPGGAVLGYLFAGSPAVVGNLWSVTDRDLDRESIRKF